MNQIGTPIARIGVTLSIYIPMYYVYSKHTRLCITFIGRVVTNLPFQSDPGTSSGTRSTSSIDTDCQANINYGRQLALNSSKGRPHPPSIGTDQNLFVSFQLTDLIDQTQNHTYTTNYQPDNILKIYWYIHANRINSVFLLL